MAVMDSDPEVADVRAHLSVGDRIVSIAEVQRPTPRRPPSTLRALLTLAGAVRTGDVGKQGPLKAATTQGRSSDAPAELRLFEALFARDALWVVHFLGTYFPGLRSATILALSESQGAETDSAREEEPGRIAHEVRSPDDPVARELSAKHGWGWPYYGAIDTTPLFVSCVRAAVSEGGVGTLALGFTSRSGRRRVVADAVKDALVWLMRRQDADADGLISYKRSNPEGIENQFWRDSWDALSHADGSIANHARPIAALHVQGLAYDALLDGAALASHLTIGPPPGELRARAQWLRESVLERFWTSVGETSFPAIAIDYDPETGARRRLATRSSDMAHLMATGMLDDDGDEARWWRSCITRNLSEPTMVCAAGLRSLDSRERRFWEGGYHTGSCWLWDTMLAAEGLRRHGMVEEATDLEYRCWRVCHITGLLPEFARGAAASEPSLTRRVVDVWQAGDRRVNRLEQPPQEVQAWTVAALHRAKRRFAVGLLPACRLGPQV
jgi:glycogen debranching enzyme